MELHAHASFIDRDGKVHNFEHRTDQLGPYYVWSDITGFQHALLRNMDMGFDLWVGEVIRGICIAHEVAE